jgi:hypothetical protein
MCHLNQRRENHPDAIAFFPQKKPMAWIGCSRPGSPHNSSIHWLARGCKIGVCTDRGGALEPRLFAPAPDLVPFSSLASRVRSARIVWPCDRLGGPVRSRCRRRLPARSDSPGASHFDHRGQRQHHLKSVAQRDNVQPGSTTAEQITPIEVWPSKQMLA